MNVKEYIESGILEAYVLGALPENERAEVEANIAQYPELATEVLMIEDAMRGYAEKQVKEVPADMQDKIWNALQAETSFNTASGNGGPLKNISPESHKVIPLEREEQEAPEVRWQRAAVWIALAGSLLANIILWSQRNGIQNQQVTMRTQMDSMKTEEGRLANAVDNYQKEVDIMSDSTVHTIVLKSMKPSHPMVATVYWSSDKGATYLSAQKLPMPPKGMQYQMWVIQNGKPVSMGVLPNNMIATAAIKKMPMEVKEGQAFAISLEKEGGSPVPTMQNIYVMGKVPS